MASCNSNKESIDLIVKNAIIYSVDSAFSVHTAMGVDNGKIVGVGSIDDIRSHFTSDDEFDASGLYIYPGFIDPHCHFTGYAVSKQSVDLREARSLEEVVEMLKAYQETHPGTFLVGRGWDQNNWPGRHMPDNGLLNEAFPDSPVVLTRIDGHAVLVNEKAIEMLEFVPGKLPRNDEALLQDGKFTGVFLETTADEFKALVEMPRPEQLRTLIAEAAEDCYAVGLTYVSDAGLDAPTVELLDNMQQSGRLKMGLYVMLNPTEENYRKYMERGVLMKDKLNVRSIKLYADGALGSRGACLLRPYSDDQDNYGILTISPDSLGRHCVRAYDNNYQVNVHCIGDSAVRTVLDVFSNYLLPGNDRRWRIEHAQIVHPQDMDKFGQFAIIPSIQSTHATSDMDWAGKRLGARLGYAYAYKRLLKQNGWLPNGTDFPIEQINPVYTFYAAVARKDLNGWPPHGFQKENALTRQEAMRSMTLWAAKGCFEENRRGSLETGKNADFVMLDKDLMVIPEAEMPHVKVVATYIDGERVWERNEK